MSYDELYREIGEIKSRLSILEGEVKHMSQVKDDVKFIKDRSVIRDEQMSIFQSQMTAMQSSSLRIEMLLRGDYGSEGLVQQMASVKGQVSEHDKKLVWAAAAIATVGVIFEILMKLYGK